MLKFYLVIIFSCLLHEVAVGTETNAKEKIYYKQTVSTAADENKPNLKNVVPIVMEGQPPFDSVKINSAKVNSIKDIVKKESKTVPRKGVPNKSIEKDDQNDMLQLNSSSEKPIIDKTNTSTVSIHPLEPNNNKIANVSKISTSTQKSTTLHIPLVSEITQKLDVTTNATIPKSTRKPKPKPIITIGEKEADKPIPATPTNKSPLGMPRKIDYIVPVIITVTVLPLLGVIFYVLYKRGRDYWDKRHYRRMDFLIDGMYNE